MKPAIKSKRRWSIPDKRRALRLYAQGYTTREIQDQTAIPAKSLERWIWLENWKEAREQVTSSWDPDTEVREFLHETLKTLDKGIRSASKLLGHIEHRLDATTPPRPLKRTLSTGSHNTEVSTTQSPLEPKDLESLANALASVSSVLLRVFGK